jgi:hypothetical protein
MKHALSVLGLPVVIAVIASFGVATSSSAQNISPKYSRSPIQSVLAQSDPPAGGAGSGGGSTITPSDKAKGSNLPGEYGVVRNVSGNTVEVRTLDGTSKTLTVSDPGPLASVKRGDIIGYDVDKSGNVTRLEPPEVESTFEGTVSAIDEDQVTFTSATGETLTTTIRPSTMSRLGLTTGKQATVTRYRGTWATKVCCVEPPAPPPVEETPVQPPPAGGVEVPPPEPVKGLW